MVNVELLNRLKGETTQRELAKASGVSFASVQRAQQGKAGLNVLSKLAAYFKVPVTSLIKENNQ